MGRSQGPYKGKWRAHLFKEQDGLCWHCGERMNLLRRKGGQPSRLFATFEHLINAVDGGQVDGNNIVLAHAKCNNIRNNEEQRRAAIKRGRRHWPRLSLGERIQLGLSKR